MTLVLWDADYIGQTLLLDPQDEDMREGARRMAGGYYFVRTPDGKKYVHRLVASRAFGGPLPPKAVVHHVNYNRADNRHCNLVVCQDDAFHALLHARTNTLRAGGNPDTEKRCCACKRVQPKEAFSPNVRSWDGRHPQCRSCTNAARRGKGYGSWGPARREYQNAYRARRRAERTVA